MGKILLAAAAAALLVAAVESAGTPQMDKKAGPGEPFTARAVRKVISGWPETSRQAAAEMLERYGMPHGLTDSVMYWEGAGQWLRIVVSSDEVEHNFPMPHSDALEQTVAYYVPAGKYNDLAAFDGSLTFKRTRGELAARGSTEAMNRLALNLAHDIIVNRRQVDEARRAFADIARDYSQGLKHPYTESLRFRIYRPQDTRDPDYPIPK